jgi:dihydroorotase
MVDAVLKEGFKPDTVSTDSGPKDWQADAGPAAGSLPGSMSMMLAAGLPLMEVVACATSRAARVFPAFSDRGTLKVGAPADVALFELRRGSFEFLDNYNNAMRGDQRLFPVATVLGGRRV